MAQLSPYIASSLALQVAAAGPAKAASDTVDNYVPDEIIRYRCVKCRGEHHDEHEAQQCCMPGWLKAVDDAGGDGGAGCPVCGQPAVDEYDAVDCCLWKDLDIAARHRIARAVEGGMAWPEAIAREVA